MNDPKPDESQSDDPNKTPKPPRPSPQPSGEYSQGKSGKPTSGPKAKKKKKPEIIPGYEKETTPTPQLRNIPPEFLDMSSIKFYTPQTDASKPMNKMNSKLKFYLDEIAKAHQRKIENDRKAGMEGSPTNN
ncbi:MAG: hypothetical protein JWM04_444 [Verrucomicrobiales bacterium]|nr:hypothetical protein [Verrucomicrobiales bacterium]